VRFGLPALVLALACLALLWSYRPAELVTYIVVEPFVPYRPPVEDDWIVTENGTRTYTAQVPVFKPGTVDRGWNAVLPQLILGSLCLVGAGALGWRFRHPLGRPPGAEVAADSPPPKPLPLLPFTEAGPELLDTEGERTLIWGVGRHVSEELTLRIDLGATVRSTARAGGLPTLRYGRDRRLREVWLWLDGSVEDPALGRYADEIAASLERAGLPVRLGFFDGYPLELEWAEGQVFRPEQMEGHRQTALVAVLTDGEVLGQHLKSALRDRVQPLLRALAGWPRLGVVDFSEGESGLRGELEPQGLSVIAPEALPSFFGLATSMVRAREAVDPSQLRVWAAALALSPRPVERRAAYALRRELELDVSPWAFHRLLEMEGAVLLGGRLGWQAAKRKELLEWLVEAEGCAGVGISPGTLLAKALSFWDRRLAEEEERRLERSETDEWRGDPAEKYLVMERELLRLWAEPEAATEVLWDSRAEFGKTLRERLSELAPWDSVAEGQDRLRLPWNFGDLRKTTRYRLAELGLGGVVKGELRPPGRLAAAIGLLASLGLTLFAHGLLEREATVEASAWATEEQELTCESKIAVHGESGIEFVWICGGTFMMGSEEDDDQAYGDEKPAHPVELKGFWMATTETTNEQYRRLRPGQSHGSGHEPVTGIDWKDARNFCEALGPDFDLPTEAEWEYAARAGTRTPWSFGAEEADLEKYAWFASNSELEPHPVAELEQNPWGLYDMHGNVWEWVLDCWDETAYRARHQQTLDGEALKDPTDPQIQNDICPGNDAVRVVRGGGFYFEPRRLRSACRVRFGPGGRGEVLGFRCVRRSRPELDRSSP